MSDDEDYYGEEDFEQEDGEAHSPKKSPMKKPSTPKPTFVMPNADDDEEEEDHHQHGGEGDDDEDFDLDDAIAQETAGEHGGEEEQDEEEEDKGKGVEGLDLEHYMMGMKMVEDDGNGNHNISPAELQPLIGLQPEEHDSQQKQLRERLGYQDSERSFGDDHSNGHDGKHSAKKKKPKSSNHKTSLQEQVEDQGAKVDALLMELFPEKYNQKAKKGNAVGGSKAKKAPSSTTTSTKTVYGLAAAPPKSVMPHRHDEDDEDDEDDHHHGGGGRGGGDVLSTLDSQFKVLKKELKQKDDKIIRLMEHSSMLANQLDRYKGECARLNSKLHDANMELEAKEHRLQEALKARKKAAKKVIKK